MLRDLLGTELPIIQAPMAGVQVSGLAIAVCKAGGLGSLPCAMLGLDAVRKELAAIEAATDRPYNVNFFCHAPPVPSAQREAAWRAALAPYYREFGIDAGSVPSGPGRRPFSAEVAERVAEFAPPVVSFHFGLPSAALLARVKRWGARVLSSATTVEEARSPNLSSCRVTEKPGAPGSTRKQLIPRVPAPPVRAQTTITPARSPLVIHCFSPVSTQPSASRSARVTMAPGSLPAPVSLNANEPATY